MYIRRELQSGIQIVLAQGMSGKGKQVQDRQPHLSRFQSIERHAFLLIAALIAASLMLPAAIYQHKGCNLSLWLPDDWKVDAEESMLLASPMNDEATLQLMVLPDVANLDAAWSRYPAMLKKTVTAYRETQTRRDSSINGMKGIAVSGEGILRGVKNSIRVVVFRGPKGFVMLMWSVTSQHEKRYQPSFDGIISSIKPIS
jgi:hypothetical protein